MYSIPSNTSGVYIIICINNGVIYIGCAVSILERWQRHKRELNANNHHNEYLQRSWNKYGESSFVFGILETVPIDDIQACEDYWIEWFLLVGVSIFNASIKSNYPQNGRTGHPLTPETKAKISAKLTGGKASVETKAKLSAMRTGHKLSPETIEKLRIKNTGRKMSLESRAKMSDAWKNRTQRRQTPEERAKRSKTMIGRHFSPEHRANLSKSQIGKKRPYRNDEYRAKISLAHKGRKHTLEHSEKVADTKRKDYIATSPDGKEFFVHGLRRFCKEHGLGQTNMVQVAKGKFSHHKGWKCRYV